MKLLCDQMLSELGKWLRAAGYDTEIAKEGEKDDEILKNAIREDRYLLTCDHHFLKCGEQGCKIIFLKGSSLQEYVEELGAKLEIDWLYRPFSRCLLCNATLITLSQEMISEHVPSDVRSQFSEFWMCENCKKVYWKGSHVKRMLEQLSAWEKRSE